MPCLLLRRGTICLPGPEGPVPATDEEGAPLDPFEALDRLTPNFALLYLVDLDGIERGEPQLDYVQELARDAALWVDAGVRSADQAIDVLVAGARRAVLSSSRLRGPDEVGRAWKLSSELAFEVEVDQGRAVVRPEWPTADPLAVAQTARAKGPDHVILSPRGADPDWELVRRIAEGGPTWVDGTFDRRDQARLASAGASGGIFHVDGILAPLPARSASKSKDRDPGTAAR